MGNPTVDVEIETGERESELIRMKLEISFLVIEILKTLSSLIIEILPQNMEYDILLLHVRSFSY